MLRLSERTQHLEQSGIRAATVECNAIGGINLGQGVCDIPTPDVLKKAAADAVQNNKNVYSACEGAFELRKAISQKLNNFNKISADPHREIIVTHGSTGAFVCATITLFNPGDEVILFEPFYGYHRNILAMHGVSVKAVPINLDDFSIDWDRFEQTINHKTRAIVVCNPCNPCGKVFTKEELLTIGRLAEQHNLAIITDEIYEYITYPGHAHISIASLENFKERTITISGFSKTYNMTGWRLGYAAGPAHVLEKMALAQDYLYVCPAVPLQHAAIAAFSLPENYYTDMAKNYLIKRDMVVNVLRELDLTVTVPQGAYYMMINFSKLGFKDDVAAAQHLLRNAKVAMVTGRSFYLDPASGKQILRLCYALNEEKISTAMQQLKADLQTIG